MGMNCWSWHTPLTVLSNPSPIDHLWDIRDGQVHDLNRFTASTLPESERQQVEQRGWGRGANVYPNMNKTSIERINKGGGNTRYDLQFVCFI